MISLSTRISPEIIDLRKLCYSEYKYAGFDKIDYKARDVIHMSFIQKGLQGTSRIVLGPHIPCKPFFKIEELDYRDFETGRVAINPSIINPISKYKILSEMVKKTIAICLVLKCRKLYTGATSCNSFMYKNLVGFENVSGPEAYPPCNEKRIFLLSLDFQKEYDTRKRGVFKLTDKYVEDTKNELLKLGFGTWL